MKFEINPDYIRMRNFWHFSFFTIVKVPQCFRVCICSIWFELHWGEKE